MPIWDIEIRLTFGCHRDNPKFAFSACNLWYPSRDDDDFDYWKWAGFYCEVYLWHHWIDLRFEQEWGFPYSNFRLLRWPLNSLLFSLGIPRGVDPNFSEHLNWVKQAWREGA